MQVISNRFIIFRVATKIGRIKLIDNSYDTWVIATENMFFLERACKSPVFLVETGTLQIAKSFDILSEFNHCAVG